MRGFSTEGLSAPCGYGSTSEQEPDAMDCDVCGCEMYDGECAGGPCGRKRCEECNGVAPVTCCCDPAEGLAEALLGER